jgi:hypothetical protein
MTPVPSIYLDANDWAMRASWCWWHWLDETGGWS